MTSEGELVLRIDWEAGLVKHAEARSQRPRVASRILTGRSPEQAVTLVSTLFTICGRAQGVAAAAATDAAQAREPSPTLIAARDRSIVAETLHEHFWRVLIDWPRLAQRQPETASMGAIRKALLPWLEGGEAGQVADLTEVVQIARQSVFGRNAGAWLAISTLDELATWWNAGETPAARAVSDLMLTGPALGRSDVELLRPMEDAALAQVFDPALRAGDNFEAAPHWLGEARETGALARTRSHPLVAAAAGQWGHGIGARAVARLVELAQLVRVVAGKAPMARRHGADSVASGTGLSWVETARGLLVHRAEVQDGRVTDYRIVAPTEWNFHPRGAFVQGALALTPLTPEALTQQASLIVASLDPCVAWRLEPGHA
jgi:hypothetical protein